MPATSPPVPTQTPPAPLRKLEPRAVSPDAPAPPLVVHVALRLWRAALLTLAAVGAIVSLTLVFWEGMELARFDSATQSPAQQSRLLDDYNSHSANVAAMFGTPVELFVVLTVRVVILRFLASEVLRPQPSWRVTALALAVSGGVGYLVNNGFNALNVQLHTLAVRPVISDADLSIESNFSQSVAAAQTTNVTHSFAEATPGNPLTNTILRNLVLPCVPKPLPAFCDYEYSQTDFLAYVPDDELEFGFPQREWQARMLPRARTPTTLRLVVNASDADANSHVTGAALPMDASLAADLLLNGVMLSAQYMPWGTDRVWLDADDVLRRYPSLKKANSSSRVAPAAEIARLLPPNASAVGEPSRREWFLRESQALLLRKFNGSVNTTRSDIAVEFSHVQLTPSIAFDAVTFEARVDPSRLLQTSAGYTTFAPYLHCSPWPAQCVFAKPDYMATAVQAVDLFYDSPVQVNAFATCLDEHQAEQLQVVLGYRDGHVTYAVDCSTTSNASILVVSVAKRLEAASVLEGAFANASGVFRDDDGGNAVATELQKIYSLTVGRLRWTLQDLSLAFNATCSVRKSADCTGLDYELEGSIVDDEPPPRQRLVVSRAALPLASGLSPPAYDSFLHVRLRPLSLVRVHEPMRQPVGVLYDTITGDILLRHNVRDLEWNLSRMETGKMCSTFIEDRMQLVLNNHMYMERGLQPAYTAAMFFLFQNAAVKDVIAVVAGGAESLRFQRNVHDVAVWISIPFQNALLTIAGCGLLVLGVLGAIVWTWCGGTATRRRRQRVSFDDGAADPLVGITSPHEIARVMLDQDWFPSLLLHRHVVDAGDPSSHRRLDDFRIHAMAMHHESDAAHRVAAKAPVRVQEC